MIKFDFAEKFVPNEAKEHIKCSQNFWEFERYAEWILDEFKHKIAKNSADSDVNVLASKFSYLEIGAYAGESLYYMSQILPRGSNICLVDLPTNGVARDVLLKRTAPWCIQTYGHKINLVSGDSRNPEVAVQAQKFNKGKFDLCFIDANHEFAYALNDFEKFRGLAEWISFHDISRFNTAKTLVKHNVIQANANHLWEVLKSVMPENNTYTLKDGSVEHVPNWMEFIAYDNKPVPTEEWSEKPRGIGVLRSQW